MEYDERRSGPFPRGDGPSPRAETGPLPRATGEREMQERREWRMRGRFTVLAAVAALTVLGFLQAQQASQKPRTCDFCQREVCQGAAYTVHLSLGRTKHACCPRCGIRYE